MDIVYILGNGSLANNEEIRYSLRSAQKYMLDLDKVFVVGECPDFLTNIIHIPADDPFKKPWQNALNKIKKACQHSDLSSDFLLFNDDFFMLQPFFGDSFPFLYIPNSDGGNSGRFSYAIHCPIKLNKDLFLQMPLTPLDSGDYSVRSFYCNFFGVPGEPGRDVIMTRGGTAPPMSQIIAGADFFSAGNQIMLDQHFLQFLYELYPEPSRFEQ